MEAARLTVSEIASTVKSSGIRELSFADGTVFFAEGGKAIIIVPNTGTTYTVANPVTDRIFDVSTVTLAELARVVGTLIKDLQDRGILN